MAFLDCTALLGNRQYQECARRLGLVSSAHPLISTAFLHFFFMNALGCIHLRLHKPTLGLNYFTKALKAVKVAGDDLHKDWSKEHKRVEGLCLKSKTGSVIYNMALCYYKQGNFETALRLLSQICKSNPANFLFWFRIGECSFNVFLQEARLKSAKVSNN